jgi:hypothetical protein
MNSLHMSARAGLIRRSFHDDPKEEKRAFSGKLEMQA